MSNFINTFTAGPVGTNPANAIDSYIREDTKQALKERMELEHYPLDSAEAGATDGSSPNAQGRHIPGKVGVVGVGTTAQLTALTGMGNGALFLDTTAGYFYYYTQGSGWQVLPFGYTGVIATDAEALAGVVENKAVNPKQLVSQILAQGLKYLHVRDEKASGTAGGDFTSGAWRTRTLNTLTINTIPGASLASNQITLPAGSYRILARAPALSNGSGDNGRTHKAALYNVTSSSFLLVGSCAGSFLNTDGLYCQTDSFVTGGFTLSSPSVLELRHKIETSSQSGFGYASGLGEVEVYAEVEIWKVA